MATKRPNTTSGSKLSKKARPYYVYKLAVAYPPGSHDENGKPVQWWRPNPGREFEDEERYMGSDGYYSWPRQKMFRSEKGAFNRADLFEKLGCTVQVLRSQPIEWDPPSADVAAERERLLMERTKEETEVALSGLWQLLALTHPES